MVTWKPFCAWIPVTGQPLRGFLPVHNSQYRGWAPHVSQGCVDQAWLGWDCELGWSGYCPALASIFPIFSIWCWADNKQTLFVKSWHHLCTLQPQLWSLASSGETAAVGIVNGLIATDSERMMKQSSRDSLVSEGLLWWINQFLLRCYPISECHPFLLPLITITIISIGIIVLLQKPINGTLW